MPSSRTVSASARRRWRRCRSSSFACAKASSECMVTLDSTTGKMSATTGRGIGQMGDSSNNLGPPGWYAAGLEHIWLPYPQRKTAAPPLPVVSTQGSRIVLADGRELIDGVASWWTACHGYDQPAIRHAVAKQLKQMPHVMFGGLAHEPALRLAARLAAMLPGGLTRVLFSDSGSVAVEVALKMAAQYWLCLLYTSPSPRDRQKSRMPSSA